MALDYASWFAQWASDQASDAGSGKVPPPTEAAGTQVAGFKAGFRTAPRNRRRPRVPAYGGSPKTTGPGRFFPR